MNSQSSFGYRKPQMFEFLDSSCVATHLGRPSSGALTAFSRSRLDWDSGGDYSADRDRSAGDPVGFKHVGIWPGGSRIRNLWLPGGEIVSFFECL